MLNRCGRCSSDKEWEWKGNGRNGRQKKKDGENILVYFQIQKMKEECLGEVGNVQRWCKRYKEKREGQKQDIKGREDPRGMGSEVHLYLHIKMLDILKCEHCRCMKLMLEMLENEKL